MTEYPLEEEELSETFNLSSPNYEDIILGDTALQVTNDTAERNVNLLVTKMKKVRTHQRLQEAMVTTKDMRRLRDSHSEYS